MGALQGRGMQEVESGKFCEASGRALQGSGMPLPAQCCQLVQTVVKMGKVPGFVIARPKQGRGDLAVPSRIAGKLSAKS